MIMNMLYLMDVAITREEEFLMICKPEDDSNDLPINHSQERNIYKN